MKLTDGKKTVEIKIQRWNGTSYDPDWSNDFFEAGNLPYDEETDTYIDKSKNEDHIKGLVENGIELKVVGIVRARDGAVSGILPPGARGGLGEGALPAGS